MTIYNYYYGLTARQQRIYEKSDTLATIPLPDVKSVKPLIQKIQKLREAEDRVALQKVLQAFSDHLVRQLSVPPIKIKVLAVRPSDGRGELHGLYEPMEGKRKACISVWMRTAHHKKVVAFKSFIRTYLHELCHHLDYELFKLEDSFHTEGFFKRESSLFKQLMLDQ